MQWELGFFDGRWGPRQIGLYDLDEGRAASEVQTTQGDNSGPGVPEYLHIYTGLQRDSLEAFLETACSARGLADRADVDVDRVAALIAGMTRDPVNSMIDASEYMTTLQQLFWSRLLPTLVASSGNFRSRNQSDRVLPDAGPLWQIPMGMSANLRNWLRPLADAGKPSPDAQKRLDARIGASKEGAEDALAVSRPR
jgi:hypothetical protein